MRLGIVTALLAALLFGAGTPLAKLLLGQLSPWLLAALLYLGSGIGLWLLRRARGAPAVVLPRQELPWLAGAVLTGGMLGPVLLMLGLSRLPASGAALLLNAEAVFTALIAWFVFRENVDRRIAFGMVAIVAGSVVLSWPEAGAAQPGWDAWWPALAVVAACLAWGVDNNLTRKVSLHDAAWVAMVKGLAAGATNLALAYALDARFVWPRWDLALAAGALGFASYGSSLTLFVISLRHLGAARTGAYFSVAPFFGALVAIGLLAELVTAQWALAGALMAIGVYLHLSEQHAHAHHHALLEHSHAHRHGPDDLHHGHVHADGTDAAREHIHWHRHAPMTHAHAHFPDAHHQHRHG